VPVYMKLSVDQRRVVDVLGEFANSGIPMQITQVQFVRAPEDAPRTDSDGTKKVPVGFVPRKEDDFFHIAELSVWARAFLYEKPPDATLAAAQAPAQPTEPSPTQGEANP